jgi:hypothetical protein
MMSAALRAVDGNANNETPVRRERILAISPGARTGIATFDGRTIWRFSVLAASRMLTRPKVFSARLEKLIDEDKPKSAVIELLDFRRESDYSLEVVKVAAKVLMAHRVPTVLIVLRGARYRVFGERLTRAMMHERLVKAYDALEGCTRGTRYRWYGYLDVYWERAFAALTLALDAHGVRLGENRSNGALPTAPAEA